MLQLDLQQIISQAVSFLVLLWGLRRFAWKPLLGLLDQRRAQIEDELRKIAHGKEEVARIEAEYSRKLAQIHDEARVKVQEAILEGKRISTEIQEQARTQASAIISKSKETVDFELAKAKAVLRDQVAAMTMDAVERIIRSKLDEKTDRRLVDAVLDDLEQEGSRA